MSRLLTTLLTLCCFAMSLHGQTASIEGQISDATNGSALFGATIYLTNFSNGTSSNEFGHFRLKDLEPGTYEIQVSFIGFERITQEVQLKANENKKLNFNLKEKGFSLADIEVSAAPGTGNNTVKSLDLLMRPVKSSQDVLRVVPGLFIAQHAGGGKAEQIFLRGFDIDHGTDIAITVDGMPVNMVSHAHGQGYADLHFVIPETIERVDFDKGPYYADKGNLNTAGFVDYQLSTRLAQNKVKLEGGSFGTFRGLAMLNLLPASQNRSSLYLATEQVLSRGYFDSPQDFTRFNSLLKFHQKLASGGSLEASASAFSSSWTASGQIPERAVQSSLISRFGAIDNTEGGATHRYNLNLKLNQNLGQGRWLSNQVWWSAYDFDLLSNFTFFLNDPVNGDQIRQQENRQLWGSKHSYKHENQLFGLDASTEAAIGFRHDQVKDVQLSRTLNKETILVDLARGDVSETNFFAYLEEHLELSPSLLITTGLRYDHFRFGYRDQLANTDISTNSGVLSPKLQLQFDATSNLNLYLKAGTGFHSNDSRVSTQPGRTSLPRAYGIDLGTHWKVNQKLLVSLAVWQLDLQQEFVYVGDEAVVEASGKSQRRGIDLGLRYELMPGLLADFDVNLTDPQFTEEAEGERNVPLAPTFTSIGGLQYRNNKGLAASLRYRWLGDRPANEDNSLTAPGYFLLDAAINYRKGKFEWGLQVENLLDTEWNEAQFETESRLRNEAASVSEIHFTPGVPFSFRLSMAVNF